MQLTRFISSRRHLPFLGWSLRQIPAGRCPTQSSRRSDTRTETDAAGSFQLKSASVIGGTFSISARPPTGSAYLPRTTSARRHAEAREENVQLQLDPAVLVTGQVIEERTGEPVPNTRIVCETRYDPKVFGYVGSFVATSDADGKFSFAARPGTLDVSVEGCSCDFQMQPVQAERQVSPTKSIFTPENVFAHATLEVPPGAEGEVKLAVRRGVTVAGEIVGSNGKVPAEVTMRHAFPQYSGFTDNYRFSVYIRHGHFAIHGVPQNGDFPVVFFDAAGDEGKYLFLHGADASQSVKVQLEKCGSATPHFVDPEGRPAKVQPQNLFVYLSDQLEPGAKVGPMENVLPFSFPAWEFDYAKRGVITTDEQGQIKLTSLVPGLTYKLGTGNTLADGIAEQVTIRVGPAQHIDVPAIVVQPRPAPPRAVQAEKAKPAAQAKTADKAEPK